MIAVFVNRSPFGSFPLGLMTTLFKMTIVVLGNSVCVCVCVCVCVSVSSRP